MHLPLGVRYNRDDGIFAYEARHIVTGDQSCSVKCFRYCYTLTWSFFFPDIQGGERIDRMVFISNLISPNLPYRRYVRESDRNIPEVIENYVKAFTSTFVSQKFI